MARVTITQVAAAEEKRRIAREILESLQDWFGVPETREAYIRQSGDQPFFLAACDGAPAGFLCLKKTGEVTVELAVMGVRREYHRQGIGRKLFDAARQYAVSEGYEIMQVKTVQMGRYEDYDRTNRFYQSLGFCEFEVIPELWGPENPCQIYVLPLLGGQAALELMLRRHSYRGKYKPDPVPREHLTAIIRAGLAAPSGCNKQTTSIVAVDDPALLEKLRAEIDPPIGVTAPAMLCVLTRRINAYRDRCFATQDYSAAIENMLLEIAALGYQSCWVEGHITDEDRIADRLARILGVPDSYEMVCILPVGIAAESCTGPRKKPFNMRAWFNAYDRQAWDMSAAEHGF